MKSPEPKTEVSPAKDSGQLTMSDFDRLRDLIVGIDKDQANQVIERVSDTELRGDDMHEILVNAIEKLDPAEQRAILAHFSETTKENLQTFVTEKPEEVSAMIYPVMLPAIRKAVADSIRSSLERIDNMFKNKLSPQSIKWRLEAKRKGLSYGEVFLRHTMNYGVEEAFLIDSNSGMLMQHVSNSEEHKKDEDAVSAMFLAIERFVNDSFNDADEDLQRVTVGERIVHIAHGPKALLACVVHGSPPADFRSNIQGILESIHSSAVTELKNFSGDKSTLSHISPLMESCLELEIEKETADSTDDFNNKMRRGGQIVSLLLIGLAGFIFYHGMQQKRINTYISELNTQPNIQVFSSAKESGEWVIRGIIDKRTGVSAERIKHSVFVNENKVRLNLAPVHMIAEDHAETAHPSSH